MKKLISFIAVVLSSIICFSMFACDCGNGDRDGLIVTISDSDEDIEIQIALQDAFKDYMKGKGQNVKVTYNTYTSSSYEQDLLSLQSGNKLGDVIQTSDRFASLMAYKKIFEPLDDIISGDSSFNLSDYDNEIIDTARAYENKVYYMPRSYDQVVIFINTDFFNAIGVDYPKPDYNAEDPWGWWTWDECEELCDKIKLALVSTFGPDEAEYYYPMAANLFWNPVNNALIKSFGGKTVDVDDATISTGFNTADEKYAETLKAVEYMRKLAVKGWTSSTNDERFLASRGSNKCTGMWFTTRPNVLKCLNNDINLAFAPVPKITETQTGKTENTTYVGYGSAGYALSALSSQKTLAWEFVKFCASEAGQKIISDNGASVPTLNSLKNTSASWVNSVKDKNGSVIDQNAFLYNGNTRTLSTYARGVKAEEEYKIYESVQSKIISGITKDPAVTLCSDIYSTIKDYLKK